MSEQAYSNAADVSASEGPGWFRTLGSGWSTVLLIGVVATASQFVAASMAGLEIAPGARSWSSGGVVAVIGGLLMWKLARSWRDFKRWIWLPLLAAAVLSFTVVGLVNSYDVEIVDQEARPATESVQLTGAFNVVEGKGRVCEPGEDYLYCVNAHVALYNSVCVDQNLSFSAGLQCNSLIKFVDDIKRAYEENGYEYTTGEVGKWGWPQLRLEAETALQSNNDAQPRLTHTERCHFDLGAIQVGTCEAR